MGSIKGVVNKKDQSINYNWEDYRNVIRFRNKKKTRIFIGQQKWASSVTVNIVVPKREKWKGKIYYYDCPGTIWLTEDHGIMEFRDGYNLLKHDKVARR